MMKKDKAKIYVAGNKMYETWISLSTLEKEIGDEFIHVHRGCLVSTMAIHDITKTVNLINGESLHYTPRKKKQLIEEFRSKQRKLIHGIVKDGCPKTMEEYADHYKSFEKMPFAFADIEMIFDDEKRAPRSKYAGGVLETSVGQDTEDTRGRSGRQKKGG